MPTKTLILYLTALCAVTLLALGGKVTGEAWLALVAGSLLPSPLSRQPKASLPLLLLFLGVGACNGNRLLTYSPPQVVQVEVQSGLGGDYLAMKPQATNPLATGKVGLWASNAVSPNDVYLVDAAGNSTRAGTARRLLVSAGAPGGTPANGDVYFDSGTSLLNLYVGGWAAFPSAAGIVTLTGTQELTNKTLTAMVVKTGLTASGSAANNFGGSTGDFTLSTGSVAWTGAAGKTVTLTQGVATTGSPAALTVTGGAHTTLTASTEASDVVFNLARTAQFATGALATQRALRVMAPTYAFAGASTLTNAATMAISGPPVAGTNATLTNTWALWLQSGYLNAAGNIVTPSIGTSTAAQHVLPTGTGDLVSTDATQTLTNKTVTGAPMVIVTGGAATAIAAGATGYLVSPGIAASSATLARLAMLTRAGTVQKLYCVADTLPGGGETETCAVKRQVGGSGALSATTVTCTIDGTGLCNDTAHSQANVAGTALVIECVQSAGSVAAGVTCSFEVAQ